MRQLQTYTYTIPANGSVQIPAANDNFIVQASTGTVTVRGDTFGTLPSLVAGQGLKSVPFNRLELVDTSGAPNTVSILLTPAEFINQVFSGSVAVVGPVAIDAASLAALESIDLNTATLNTLTRPTLPGANWVNNATLAANTPVAVFLPAANTNGALIWMAEACDIFGAGGSMQAFLAQGSTPASIVDGQIIALGQYGGSGASPAVNTKLQMATRIAAGLGLYFISTTSGGTGNVRACRYTLL